MSLSADEAGKSDLLRAGDCGGLAALVERAAGVTRLPMRWGRLAAVAGPLIVLNTGWIANSEMKTWITEVTISSLFMGVTFILFIATLVNLAVRRRFGRAAALNQPEMMALYTMLSMSSVVAGVGHFGFFLPFLAGPFDPQASHADWRGWLYLLPRSIGPRDPSVLLPFYVGRSTFFRPSIMRAWAYPLAVWGAFFLILLWTMLCLAAILRRRWEEEEHLPFPIIALPLEMTREGAPIYSNPVLWLGFAVPAALHSLNSLHSLFPIVPGAPINSVRDLVTNAGLPTPWSGMGTLFLMLHPVGVGFGYLIGTDVSFSLWFFFVVKKAVDVVSTAVGLRSPAVGWWYADGDGEFPYLNAQGWGAWLLIALLALWTTRKDIAETVRRALDGSHGADGRPDEPMSARVAVFGFAGGFAALCGYIWALGGSWWLPVAFLALTVLFLVTLTRLRAETAVLCSELVWVNPQSMLPAVLGTANLSHTDLVHMGMLSWFNLDYRAPGLSHELEGLVAQYRSGGKMSPLVWAIMLASALATVSALIWDLQLYYVNGAATGNVNQWRVSMGMEPWNDVQAWIQNPQRPDNHALIGILIGAGITLLLSILRHRYVGFPLHPAGYALNMTFANDFFWCDMLLAWMVKSAILRYGGMKTYRAALPFFLGLILGDFVTGSAWSILGTIFHLTLFRTFPT